MRSVYQQAAGTQSQLIKFLGVLTSQDYRRDILGILLLDGTLLKAPQEGGLDFKVRKDNLFYRDQRVRAILCGNQSVVMIDKGVARLASIDEIRRFVLPLAEKTAKVHEEKPPVDLKETPSVADDFSVSAVEPAHKKPSAKSAADLDLFRRIVQDNDYAAFVLFLESNRRKLNKFAWKIVKNEAVAEEAVQEATARVLEQMGRKAQGHDSSLCRESDYFSTWFHSIVHNEATKILGKEIRHRGSAHVETVLDRADDNSGSIVVGAVEEADPGVLCYRGHEDPLAFLLRLERQIAMQERVGVLQKLADEGDQGVEMTLQVSAKMAGGELLGGGCDYETVARARDIAVGTVKSGVHRVRRELRNIYPELV